MINYYNLPHLLHDNLLYDCHGNNSHASVRKAPVAVGRLASITLFRLDRLHPTQFLLFCEK